MGLIAVVYLAKQNLSFDMVKEGAEQDARTGAIYFQDTEKKKKYPREMRQAIRIKLGTGAPDEPVITPDRQKLINELLGHEEPDRRRRWGRRAS